MAQSTRTIYKNNHLGLEEVGDGLLLHGLEGGGLDISLKVGQGIEGKAWAGVCRKGGEVSPHPLDVMHDL